MSSRSTLIGNLHKHFPDATRREIEAALKKSNNHGGKATALLSKLHRPPSPVAVGPSPEEQADTLGLARSLLDEYCHLDIVPVVPAQELQELRTSLPDLADEQLRVSLLRNRGDVERARNWLWGPDAGANFRREQAFHIDAWERTSDSNTASYCSSGWTQCRLVLGRLHQTYAYSEEHWTETATTQAQPGTIRKGLSKLVKAGGKWAMESHEPGFTLVLEGEMTTEVRDTSSGHLRETLTDDHELILCVQDRPFAAPTSEENGVDIIKRRFRQLDKNKDGMIDFNELRCLLHPSGKISDEEVRVLFDFVDRDGSGAIQFEEFVDFVFPSSPKGDGEIDGTWCSAQELRQHMSGASRER